MYLEIILIAIIAFALLFYNQSSKFKYFLGKDSKFLLTLQEKDYEFLLKAKYGDRVYDANLVFQKRVYQGIIAMMICFCFFLSELSFVNICISVGIGFFIFKSQYIDLKNYYKKHLNYIDSLLPYYLKSLEILVQHYTVPVALARSIEDAPEVFVDGLRELVGRIDEGDSSVDPYMEFAQKYPVRDSIRMMRLLYRLSLGEQDKKHEQMLSFSKSVSALQMKAREQKYKSRLTTMENQSMKMLVYTGGAALIIMLIGAFSMMGI